MSEAVYRVASQLEILLHVGWGLVGVVVECLRFSAIRLLASVWAEPGNFLILMNLYKYVQC